VSDFYDGVDYRYSSSDENKTKAIQIISNIVGLLPETDGLEYSLRLYAGGIGVDDRIAIRFKFQIEDWPTIYKTLRLKEPDEAVLTPEWGEHFEWLVSGKTKTTGIEKDVLQFINTHKHLFQDSAELAHAVAFSDESNVNNWCVVWTVGNWFNYLSFDQG